MFIGFYHLNGVNVTDDDVYNILKRIDGDYLVAVGRHIYLRKGKICDFYNELTKENAESVNIQTTKYLKPELIEKFNKTCPLPNTRKDL